MVWTLPSPPRILVEILELVKMRQKIVLIRVNSILKQIELVKIKSDHHQA